MGTVLFAIAVVVEIAFAVFCVCTKSNQVRTKTIIRVSAWAGFTLLVGLGIVDWSLRYYALYALLLLLAGIGTVGLARRKEDTRAFKAVRVVLTAMGMILVFFALTLPAIIFPQHETLEVSGEYQVATATYTYVDTNRIETYTDTGEFRKLNVGLWYPENATGKFPLVVFSPGGMSVRTSNESLYRELASNGYVVAAIDHPFHSLFTTDEDGSTVWIDRGYMKDLQSEDATSNKQQSYQYYQTWMAIRTGDISFVIDHILSEAEADKAAVVYKLVDTARIGVIGHSLGGSAALGIGRIRDDVSAVIALESPFMYDIVGVKDDAFVFTDVVYPVPVLDVYSDSAWSHLAEWPQYARNHDLLSDTKATAFNVHISGAGHFSLTDLALTSPILTRMLNGFPATADAEYCLKTINQVSLAFFDCYLKGACPFSSSGTYSERSRETTGADVAGGARFCVLKGDGTRQ